MRPKKDRGEFALGIVGQNFDPIDLTDPEKFANAFHEYTGRWPSRITVVGYEMKRRRFAELHRVALRWPADRFDYVGIDAGAGHAFHDDTHSHGALPPTTGGREPHHVHSQIVNAGKDKDSTGGSDIEKPEHH